MADVERRKGDRSGNGCAESRRLWKTAALQKPTAKGSEGELCRSVGAATDGTDGAGLTSQIDVQARGEGLERAHTQESCSEIQARSMPLAYASHILNVPTCE
ncbi:hypothetical protein GCM10010320_30290 [Streptomyces caelestis]|nr:hypothetical protein GCM10010320_30290 [Streptomyces caelestis]